MTTMPADDLIPDTTPGLSLEEAEQLASILPELERITRRVNICDREELPAVTLVRLGRVIEALDGMRDGVSNALITSYAYLPRGWEAVEVMRRANGQEERS